MKTIFISGAARRIGAIIAEYLHAHGYQILLHYHQSEQEAQTLCQELCQKRPNSVHLIKADLANPDAADTIFQVIKQLGISLDGLIHNASMFSQHDKDFAKMFQINVLTPYRLSRLCYPLLAKTNGSIINITDIHAEKPLKNYTAYVQTKAAFKIQTEALALEYAPEVRVNAIAPGISLWPEHDNELSDSLKNEILDKIPMHDICKPIHIAKTALFLLDNDYINGQTIRVDGGRLLT
jgi:pteridine reductase